MDHRYIVRELPHDAPLICEVCREKILSPEEVTAARESHGRLNEVIAAAVEGHLMAEHSQMFDREPEVLIEPGDLHPHAGGFPDEKFAENHDSAVARVPPPRSPDESVD